MIKASDAVRSGSCGVGFVCNVAGQKNHKIIQWGIEAVRNLTHRGAVGADGKTGDGAGVLFQIPKEFFSQEMAASGMGISHIDNLAVGVFFLRDVCEPEIEGILKNRGMKLLGWRTVPTNDEALGKAALSAKPVIRQVFLDMEGIGKGQREISLYLARRIIEKTLGEKVYVCSLSSKVIVYKGMLVATHLESFYPDLVNESVESAFCIFHQRFSTNTFPDWTLAQPFRVLAHNGEINTIRSNRNWISSIEPAIRHETFGSDQEILKPVLSGEESDSASLDRIIELLLFSGYSLEHAINLCIPPAWECCDIKGEEQLRKAGEFFEFQSFLMKPWDGPAAVVLTDGDTICAHLDRNGLRPMRYTLTEDGILVLGSETGMIELEGKTIKKKDRLGPGDTLSVDLAGGRVRYTREIITGLAEQKPYGAWTERFLVRLPDELAHDAAVPADIIRKQIAFGYSAEEINVSLTEMARKAKEPTYSMGDDTPLPALSEKPQLLYRYFKQRFSQVTNPPIDSLRERIVMSLRMNLGHKMNFLLEQPEHARRLKIDSPVLLESQMRAIQEQTTLKVTRVSLTFPKKTPGALLPVGVRKLQEEVVRAVKDGTEILVLSDYEISKERPAIPALLATAASFKALRRENIANRASIIVETGEARDVHDMACLIGYNASAVFPYLAFQTIRGLCDKGTLSVSYQEAVHNYKKALDEGLLKVVARMGISTLSSYYGSHLFDAVCLNSDFVEEFFTGTPVTIESDGMDEIEKSLLRRHNAGFDHPDPALEYAGTLRYRKGGEYHAWSPSSVVTLHKYLREKDEKAYRDFSRRSNEEPAFIRQLLHYRKGDPVPLEEVEAEEHILKRFFSGAMSVGALSPEAHETIAEACNSMGIKSNSGEGGEDPERYFTIKNSAIKQIASGRFGVTPAYLASARELEIKMAQGAKPGEGGLLPADKVTGYIGRLRHCSPGTILISPPPHHDIYSIEDLAQLINDLKEANPRAKVCVKLVSESGVGTVAAGVAKAYADIVQISGCDGGTGAASLSSIKNAGNYWEIGLAETQRVLIENGLRDRITVRVDGGLRTGKDIVIAALLGSEEFGFGTATMISAGCIMARQCHANTCPTGIATQDERLRKKFKGKAEDIIFYFRAIAREVRGIMAEMGVRSLAEIIGRNDLLDAVAPGSRSGAGRIRLDRFYVPYPDDQPKRCLAERNDNPAVSMNRTILADLLPSIEKAEPVQREYFIRNINRSIPATLNYHIALKCGDTGLPPDTIQLTFRGTSGQSFGAFNHKGLSLTLVGDANDYVGKGMFGGRIVIKPSSAQGRDGQIIAGNTVLYGATGGEFFAAGRAGERFAVRNSGATAVVEGTGQHLCEYMTRGIVVVLGDIGHNVGAGMSGGTLYVYDPDDTVRGKLNSSYVQSVPWSDKEEMQQLKALLEAHYGYTGSNKARDILENSEALLQHFRKIIPRVA